MEIEVHGHLSRLIGGDLFPQRSYQLESYVAEGMTAFDCPGLAIGIVAGDRLVYAKGLACKKGGEPVDTRTVFQISSATKGFLATTLAIAVDRGKFRWELWPQDHSPPKTCNGCNLR